MSEHVDEAEASWVRIRSSLLSEGLAWGAFTGPPASGPPWRRVEIRPIQIRHGRHLQFTYYSRDRAHAINLAGPQVAEEVDRLIEQRYRGCTLHTEDGSLQVQVTKHGRTVVRNDKCIGTRPDTAHDRIKPTPLPSGDQAGVLVEFGIMSDNGRIKPNNRGKFVQVNNFLRLLQQAGAFAKKGPGPLRVLDLGCGNAYLSFATYHYVRNVLGLDVNLTGIDQSPAAVERNQERVQRLGWTDLEFIHSSLTAAQVDSPPDLVLALHVCDTATDEALARAVKWNARYIFAAPCCHRDIQRQLKEDISARAQSQAILQHGVLTERIGDVLTDASRALLLRMCGYRTDIVEFTDPAHTAKNLLIRAKLTDALGSDELHEQYRELVTRWRIRPRLATLLEGSNSLQDLNVDPRDPMRARELAYPHQAEP